MKIVADQQIPLVQDAFAGIGEIIACDNRQIDQNILADADVLLVRSVTSVDEKLLEHSPVKFVGTATSGIDHIDIDYLYNRNISLATAHGCNAQAVVEYVLSSLFVLAKLAKINPFDKTVGIIGCGKTGSRLLNALRAIDIECVVNDPPLKEKTGDDLYIELADTLAADIISLHVPLITHGQYPTRHLVNKGFLDKLQPNAILINTSRGGVIYEEELQNFISNHINLAVALDVWENEPDIKQELLAKVTIGTPHIAGYSVDAKITATKMLYTEFCQFFNLHQTWEPPADYLNMGKIQISIDGGMSDQDAIQLAVLSHFDVRNDADRMHRLLNTEPVKTAYNFEVLRRNYPARRDFPATTIILPATKTRLAATFRQLGFNIMDIYT
jgi:erythronate-4-phosphate dehydrogenase